MAAWRRLAMLLAAAAALVLCGVHASVNDHDPSEYVYHRHSVFHPYTEGGFDIPNWDYQGSAMIMDEAIRLTPDRQSRWGHLWNKQPWNPAEEGKYPSWEMQVEFRVHGQGTRMFGDGFAIWYTKDRMEPGPVFGSKDEFVGLGVFFDTYSNVQQGGHGQYVSVMVGDGTGQYDHANDGGDSKLAGCWHDFRGTEHSAYVRIVYDNNLLRVYLDTEDEDDWEECFIIRRLFLPRGYYFGVTAATGDLADNHDVISVKVTDPEPMDAEEKADVDSRIEQDIADGVDDNLVHHDPQYKDQVKTDPSPMLLIAGLGIFAVVVALVYYLTLEKKKSAVHFT